VSLPVQTQCAVCARMLRNELQEQNRSSLYQRLWPAYIEVGTASETNILNLTNTQQIKFHTYAQNISQAPENDLNLRYYYSNTAQVK
jgi:hypothetical protein